MSGDARPEPVKTTSLMMRRVITYAVLLLVVFLFGVMRSSLCLLVPQLQGRKFALFPGRALSWARRSSSSSFF